MEGVNGKVKADVPRVTFDPFQDRINVHRGTAEALGWPEYCRFLFHPKKKRFAVQACGVMDKGAERMPQSLDGINRYVNSAWLVRFIFSACGWKTDRTRRVSGVLHSRHRLVEFDLNDAMEIAREETLNAEQKGNAFADRGK